MPKLYELTGQLKELERLVSENEAPLSEVEDTIKLIEGEFEENSQKGRVRQAILGLTADQQHVLALRFSEERSLQETADIMEKSVSAVKALQFRAVAALQRQLSE